VINRISGPGVLSQTCSVGWSLSPLPPADQQAEVELPQPPTEDDPWPMAQITELRRSSHTSLPTAAIPRFGVQTDQEEQLAKVGLPRATGLSFLTCTWSSRDKCGAAVTRRSLKTPTNGDLMCSKWLS
jgi:hypothetical protein